MIETEQIQRQRTGTMVDVINGVLDTVVGQDGQDRAENFLLHDSHAVVSVKHQDEGSFSGVRQVLQGRVDFFHTRAPRLGVIYQLLQAAIMSVVDDRRAVGIV